MKRNKGYAARVVTGLLLFTATSPSSAATLAPSLSGASTASRDLVSRESSNATTVPVPIVVSPSQYFEGDDGPWSSFAIQVGRQVQNVRLFPGTASTSTWTISNLGCPPAYGPDCAVQRGGLYNYTKSSTYYPLTMYDVNTEVNLGMDTVGDVGYEDLVLGYLGSDTASVSHSVVFSLVDYTYWIGILGIDPRPTNFSTLNSPQPSILQILLNNNQVSSLSYGYTAGNQYRLNKVFGSLTLGGYDQNRFLQTNVTFPFNGDTSRDLSVNLQAITTDGGSPSNLLPGGSINILIDSTIAALWLPQSACTAFEQAFGLVWNSAVGYYIVNGTLHEQLVAKNPNVTFTIGPQISGGPTVDIVLPYAAFDLNLTFPNIFNPNTSYYFPLKRAANDTQYTLGRTFLQEAYLIADYGRQNFTVAPCNWNQSAIQSSDLRSILGVNQTINGVGTHNSTSSGLSSGAIAGIVVGVVVGILLIAAAAFFFFRKRQQASRDAAAAAAAQTKNSSESNNDAKPFLAHGELGGGEIHEMVAPHKPFASELDTPEGTADPNKHGYSEVGDASYFEPSKTLASEMSGSTPVYEMPGSDVHEMPNTEAPAQKPPK